MINTTNKVNNIKRFEPNMKISVFKQQDNGTWNSMGESIIIDLIYNDASEVTHVRALAIDKDKTKQEFAARNPAAAEILPILSDSCYCAPF